MKTIKAFRQGTTEYGYYRFTTGELPQGIRESRVVNISDEEFKNFLEASFDEIQNKVRDILYEGVE